jgi:hypothetical protein
MKIISRRTALMLTGLVSVASLFGAGGAAAEITVDSDPILYWNNQAQALLPGSTPIQSRSMAMVNIAMHDAVNATTGAHDRYYLSGVANPGGDARVAASQAAHDVLVGLNPGNQAQYDAALAAYIGPIASGAAKTNGSTTGAAYAGVMLANRGADGSTASAPYVTTGLPGDWRPTTGNQVGTPQWGDVTPFLMTSPDQFRPGAPPALTSAQYAVDYNEVQAIGAAGSLSRTEDQGDSAQFWASGSASQAWIRIGLALAEDDGLSTLENARTFALLSSVMADSQIAGFDSKFEYRLWRPVTAIRLGDTDGNALTLGDAGWASLVSAPAFPSYVSTHSVLSRASAISLSSIFGNDDEFCITLAFGERCFDNVGDAALDASNSRIWGGIHFRFDTDAGLVLGQQLGDYAVRRGFFAAVPEPGAWAMMLTGFGLLGAMARRRRAALKAGALAESAAC